MSEGVVVNQHSFRSSGTKDDADEGAVRPPGGKGESASGASPVRPTTEGDAPVAARPGLGARAPESG
eukprot:3573326-Pyramimonas_sp.AAC.1